MRPNEFVVEPFVGALPLKFSMTDLEVEGVLGPADRVGTNWKKEPCWSYNGIPDLSLGFDPTSKLLVHIGLGKTARVRFGEIDLFREPLALRTLLEHHEAYLWVGFVVFNEIGLAFADFGEHGWDKTAVVVFPEASWDKAKTNGKPFVPADLEITYP